MDPRVFSEENEFWLQKRQDDGQHKDKDAPFDMAIEDSPLKQRADEFADKTSLHGVNFMRNAHNNAALTFFVCVFMICIGMTITQMHGIFRKYFEYPVDTKVTLTYEKLDFPTATICNVNPFRASRLPMDFEMHLAMCLSDNETGPGLNYEDIEKDLRRFNMTQSLPDDIVAKLKGQEDYADDYCKESLRTDKRYNETIKRFRALLLADSDDRDDEGVERDISMNTIYRKLFLALVSSMSKQLRLEMGHQLNESLIYCTFNGFECDHRDFRVILNGDYGNCFQFNSAKKRARSRISRQPGPQAGLNLILYNQHFEYTKAYTRRSGFRIAIHPFNTLEFPLDNGLSVSTGVATDIGLRVVNISRLGGKYGKCEDDDEYMKKYGTRYTTQMCHAVHLERAIMHNCQCMRFALFAHYPRGTNLTSCSLDAQKLNCVQQQITKSYVDYYECNPACKEISYEFISSQYLFPELVTWSQLVKKVCQLDKFTEGCLGFLKVQLNVNASKLESYVTTNNQLRKLRANFAEVRVYYTDLNYELIQEEASYDTTHLGGDIGGALGLWFGMSVFTGVELITFFLSLIITCAHMGIKRK